MPAETAITLTYTIKSTDKGTTSLIFRATGNKISSAVFAIEVLPRSADREAPAYRFSHVCSPMELSEFPEGEPGDSCYFRTDTIELVFDTPDMVNHVVSNMQADVSRLVREALELEMAEGVTYTNTFDGTNTLTPVPPHPEPGGQVIYGVIVDDGLSTFSENPVQNKVVTSAIYARVPEPEEEGTKGQVLALDDGGRTKWVDQKGGSGYGEWGSIRGNIEDQMDLIALMEGKQDVIDEDHKLDYGLLSNTPTIPEVGSGVITITQGGIFKGSFSVNTSQSASVELDAQQPTSWGQIQGSILNQADLVDLLEGKQDTIDTNHPLPYSCLSGTPTIGSGTVMITQGGVSKGSFNVNATGDTLIALEAGGGSAVWGGITGTLADQTDLAMALSGKQDTIDAQHKLVYSLLSNTPSIPSVGSGLITITQGGVSKGSFSANATDPVSINVDAPVSQVQADWTQADNQAVDYIRNKPSIPSVGSATITLTQGGVSKGSFNVNATDNSSIDIDAPVAQVQANWAETDSHYLSFIQSKPVIPTVNDAEVTFTQDGVSKGRITLNQAQSATIALDGGISTVTWGGISGTLSDQQDLNSALSAKQDTIDAQHKLDYALLSNTPGIPVVGSAMVTITQGGVSKGSFNVNASNAVSVEVDAPTPVSWGGIQGNITSQADLQLALSTMQPLITNASRLDYGLLSNTPTIGSGTLTLTSGGQTVVTFTANQTTDQTFALPPAGEDNVIESVTFNGSSVPVTNKTAAISASIPQAPVQADWGESDNTSLSYIRNKPTIGSGTLSISSGGAVTTFNANAIADATVVIPTVNDATVTLTQGGTSKGSFTLNQSGNVSIDLDAGGGGEGSAVWGGITGTLSNQTDLQNALNGKQATIDANNKLDYALLSNTPTIPTVNDATITLTQGGVTKGTFNVNQGTDQSIDLDAGGGAVTQQDITVTTDTALSVSPGGAYDWTPTADATLTLTGAVTGKQSITAVNIHTGGNAITLTNITLTGYLVANATNYCGIYFDGASAYLYVYNIVLDA